MRSGLKGWRARGRRFERYLLFIMLNLRLREKGRDFFRVLCSKMCEPAESCVRES